MALTYLDVKTLKNILTCMWHHFASTDQDPANGQWDTTDPNDMGGLYGGLNDSIPQQIVLHSDLAVYRPAAITAETARVDNLNGLNPSSTVKLQYAYARSLSSTHSVTKTVARGAEFSVEANAEVVKAGAKFSVNFTFSSTDTKTETKTESAVFEQSVEVKVPKGKIYQVVLTAEVQEIEIPYTVPVVVTGLTNAWWEDLINPRGYHWSLSAGEAFDLIKKYGCAGVDSPAYGGNEDGNGIVTLSGVVKASQVANFAASVYDVTDQSALPEAVSASQTSAASDAPLVERIMF